MAMVGVDSGSLYRRSHSLSRLAWSWVGGRRRTGVPRRVGSGEGCPQKNLKFNSANLFIFPRFQDGDNSSIRCFSFIYCRLRQKSPLHFATSHNTLQQSQLHTWQSQLHTLCQKTHNFRPWLLPPSSRRSCDRFRLSVIPSFCLSFCVQDYCKSNRPILLKLIVMIGPTSRKNWLTFGGDTIHDQLSTSLTIAE